MTFIDAVFLFQVTFDLTYADRVKKPGGEEKEGDKDAESDGEGESEMPEEDVNGDLPVQPPTPLIATCFGCGLKNINMSVR